MSRTSTYGLVVVLLTMSSALGCASRLPSLTLAPELLKDPVHYQVLGKERISLRELGNDLRRTVVKGNLDFMMQPIRYNASFSEHLLVVNDNQDLQVNKSSDTLLIAIEGHGYMEGVKNTAIVWENEIIRVPRNTPHAFINASTMPTVLYAVFSPPYDDRQVFAVKTKRSTFFVDESTPIGVPQQ